MQISLYYSLSTIIKKWFDSLPNNYQPAVLTASATLVGAFLGAVFAQWVSHKLTKKRENNKYMREIYQNLFAPILSNIYAFLDISSHSRKGHDVKNEINETEILNQIIEHIGKNLRYATPPIISIYNKTQINNLLWDFSGFMHDLKKIELIETSLIELYYITRKTSIFNKKTNAELVKYIFLYKIWMVFFNEFDDVYKSAQMLSLKFYFKRKKLNWKNYKKTQFVFKIKKIKITMFYQFKLLLKNIKTLESINITQRYNDECYNYILRSLVEVENLKEFERYSNFTYINPKQKFNNVSSVAYRLVFDISYQINQDIIVLDIKVNNHSEELILITQEDFVLAKFGGKHLENLIDKDNYLSNSYKLLPDESIKFKLRFKLLDIDDDENNNYILCLLLKDKLYKLYEVKH